MAYRSRTGPSNGKPRVLCLSAYDAESHQRWRESLPSLVPDVDWVHLALPPRYFRWRIRGNPLSWYGHRLLRESWDALVVTSMVDLATLRGLNPHLARVPALAYFHENQFAYPVQDGQVQSIDPQMVNLYTALAADRVAFNSEWNRASFVDGVQSLMKRLPDGVPDRLEAVLEERACLLPVPIDDHWFHARQPGFRVPLHLVWNHRWEFDKGPDRLLLILRELEAQGLDFRLSLVGQQFRQIPEAFEIIRQRFEGQLAHWGYLEDKDTYRALLQQADVVLSTALHDFQGLSVLEAMASGCVPVVPDRLAYPEYVPSGYRYASLEAEPEQEARGAARLIADLAQKEPAQRMATPPEAYRRSCQQSPYQALMQELLESG